MPRSGIHLHLDELRAVRERRVLLALRRGLRLERLRDLGRVRCAASRRRPSTDRAASRLELQPAVGSSTSAAAAPFSGEAASRLASVEQPRARPPAPRRGPPSRRSPSSSSRPATGALRQPRVAELELHLLRRQAQVLGGDHGHHRVGAGADVARRAGDVRGAVGVERDPDGRPAAGTRPRCRSPCPSRRASARRASSAARACACSSRTAPRPAGSTRAAPCSRTACRCRDPSRRS